MDDPAPPTASPRTLHAGGDDLIRSCGSRPRPFLVRVRSRVGWTRERRGTSRNRSDMKPGDVPLTIRLSHEIPKPRDWQAFERGCLILFREELRSPTMLSFGRSGQDQGGIDLLGRRADRPDHVVGVQCRLKTRHDKQDKVLSDCRAAIALGLDLKELIFATTAPNDVSSVTMAHTVEKRLRAEGHDLKVVIYGWGNLQELIGRHSEAYTFFFPAVLASYADLAQGQPQIDVDQLAISVAKHLGVVGVTEGTTEAGSRDISDEDPRLHARIDVFRNLYKDGEAPIAERRLLDMLGSGELDGKPGARSRVETILGSIAIDSGRERDAADRFETAHSLHPGDPDATARLALARTIQGRHLEAMEIAREVLLGDAKEHVVGFLLQAAARADWRGDPEDLIPERFRGSPAADLGLAEFSRLRDFPDWARRSLDLAARHPDVPEFRRVRGLATLSLLVSSDAVVPGVRAPLEQAAIQQGADDLKVVAERCLAIGYATGNDLVAHLTNAGAMLRLAGRNEECEALLRRGVERLPGDPQVRRQLALAQSAQGRRQDALRTLGQDADPENVMLRAELTSADDPDAALAIVRGLQPTVFEPSLGRVWARSVGDLACRVGDGAAVAEAVAHLRRTDPGDLNADLIEIAWDIRAGEDPEEARDRLRCLASSLPEDASAVDRYVVASRLREQDMPAEAARVLDGRVDLAGGGAAVNLYLQCLSTARRDEAFRNAMAVVGKTTDVELLWTVAVHAWNVGDLTEAERATAAIARADTGNEHARQLRIEVLIRLNRTADLLAELAGPVEMQRSGGLRERSRTASLLAHFGHVQRGAALAYRLFLENRGESQAWMTLAGIVLDAGRSAAEAPSTWSMTEVGDDAAVDFQFDDGGAGFCIVEPDLALRHLDEEALEPEHPLVLALRGLSVGGRFADPTGRSGAVTQIRHKFVARFHHVLAHHQSRFPEVNGFRRIDVEPGRPDAFEEVVEKLRERSTWFDDERRSYHEGPWSLGVLAHRLGIDTIEAAGSLVAAGQTLKVSDGGVGQRDAAGRAVVANGRRGCVMDLLCFWTAWDLKALAVVVATCGPVHLPQSVVDALRVRRDQIAVSVDGGLRSATLVDGRLAVHEAQPETVRTWLDEVDGALRWIDDHVAVEPVIVDDDLHPELREFLRRGEGNILDALVVARHADLLLLTDDGPIRDLAFGIGFVSSAWLNHVFLMAFVAGRLGREAWVRWSAALIGGGHSYMGASAAALATAAILDAADGSTPGPLLRRLMRCVGGKTAEPTSHVQVVVGCVRELWLRPDTRDYRQRVTSELLRHLTRERPDHPKLLRGVVDGVDDLTALANFVRAWSRGHFLRIA